MSRRRLPGLLASLLIASTAGHAPPASAQLPLHGVRLETIVLTGDVAPDSGLETYTDFSSALGTAGELGFAANLSGSPGNSGLFRANRSSLERLSGAGEAAPGTGGGTYTFIAGFPQIDHSGRVSVLAIFSGVTATRGLFEHGSGPGGAIVIEGDATPIPPSGSFEPMLSDLAQHGRNASGDVAFVSSVTGGTASAGLFRETSLGIEVLALVGDAAPDSGGGTFSAFQSPSISDDGRVAFVADIVGDSSTVGIFVHDGGVLEKRVLQGEIAPDTGGATYTQPIFPAVNDSGEVVFAAETAGGTATGGLFVSTQLGVASILVEGDLAPETGGGTFAAVNSLPNLSNTGTIAFSAELSGGSVSAGVFEHDLGSGTTRALALAGETAPETGGDTFSSFLYTDVNDAGEAAFISDLSGGRRGLFLAAPPNVPALSAPGLLLLGTSILAATLAGRRRSA